ncbi:MAG: MmcQ/YjbR family DNA-binding protein [Acidimicrobiales bacterium]
MAEPHDLVEDLESFALTFPEAWPDTPWDDRVVKVRKKIFLFVSRPDSEHAVATFKLPDSREHALSYPDAFPTRYGLGKHGWCTVLLGRVPVEEHEVLFDFVVESYRAVAPKTLAKQLDEQLSAESGDDNG